MAPKKQESFTVTDRRLFTTDGDLRQETQEEEQIPTSRVTAEAAPAPDPTPAAEEVAMPPLPTVDEQQAQAMLSSQASRAARLAAADDVIVNDGAPLDLPPKVAALHQHYLALAAALRARGPAGEQPATEKRHGR